LDQTARVWDAANGHLVATLSGQSGPLYGSAFLLEREGRRDKAAQAGRAVIAWHEDRGDELHADWPRRELARVLAK